MPDQPEEKPSAAPIAKAFCVGMAKSGTESFARLLGTHYRADHEPDREHTLALLQDLLAGDLDDEALRDRLLARDQRLQLDYDVAWCNIYFLPVLLRAFPEARFVALVRDCYTWIDSLFGQFASRGTPDEILGLYDLVFQTDEWGYTDEDRVLEEMGVYPVRASLAGWNRHVTWYRERIPEHRGLFLRTHELDDAHERIAGFLGIPADSLDLSGGHVNRSVHAGSIYDHVDEAWIHEQIRTHCGENMARLFPEATNRASALEMWRRAADRRSARPEPEPPVPGPPVRVLLDGGALLQQEPLDEALRTLSLVGRTRVELPVGRLEDTPVGFQADLDRVRTLPVDVRVVAMGGGRDTPPDLDDTLAWLDSQARDRDEAAGVWDLAPLEPVVESPAPVVEPKPETGEWEGVLEQIGDRWQLRLSEAEALPIVGSLPADMAGLRAAVTGARRADTLVVHGVRPA